MTAFLYRRLAYHRDGTQVFLLGPFYSDYSDKYDVFTTPAGFDDYWEFDPTALEAMNRLDGNTAFIQAQRTGLLFLFPTPMRIRGILPFIEGSPVSVSYSQDAISVDDGTWMDMGAVPQADIPVGPLPPLDTKRYSADIRTRPSSGFSNEWDRRIVPVVPGDEENLALARAWWNLTGTRCALDLGTRWKEDYVPGYGGVAPYDMRNVAALKVMFNSPYERMANLYLYGGAELGAWRNYMQIFDENFKDDTYASQMDWATAPWDSSEDRGVRIKNQSPTHTAEDIEVYFDPGNLTLPYREADMFLLSLDHGKTWYPKVVISSLGPQALSTVIKLRRVTIDGDKPGHTQALIRTEVGRWYGYEYAPKTMQVFGTVVITSTASVPTTRTAAGTVAVTSDSSGAVTHG